MFIPNKDHYFNVSPVEFEKYSLEILKQQMKGLENLKFVHNSTLDRIDGSYQIDGVIHFTVMGVQYTTLVECKHYKNSISREKIQILYDKIRATGAHKGIFISSSNYQSGAIKYAKEHGIALIQLTEADTVYVMRGKYNIIQARPNLYNGGLPYIGVMQEYNSGISCKYLRVGCQHLTDFLLEL